MKLAAYLAVFTTGALLIVAEIARWREKRRAARSDENPDAAAS